ncbi:ABC transporter, putative [Bodo saltans]|uniref:ABC transporter, putative n=1 Tax=Bodo saltans TaxID=75058 RepID=A0A0S4JD54_BODSA|nr:ABC transporter, putative [Bodo saltans]|eukprot:CUG88007.1 ABC transporter, putative [Bodo saltans]
MIDGVQATTDNSSTSPVASYSPAPGSPPHRSSTHGNDSDDHQLDHFDSALESATPVEKRCTYGAWLFLCQIYALCWKQYLVKKRRPLSTIFEILAPGLMLLILSYGIGLSPVVPIPAFQHDTVPTVYSNYTTSTDINPTAAFLVQLFESAGLYSPSNPASYFQTVLLPLLTSQSGNASIATQLSSIVFSNTDAARPFVIPGFDTYVGGITQLKAATGRLGGKSLENLDPRIWHIMNLGKIAFGNPSDDVRDMIAYFNATTNLFGSIVLCPLPTSAACNGHISSNSAESLAVALGTSVWAYIDIDVFDVPTQTFHYTIRMNESLVPPTDTIIDQFPQGIGTAYAKYIYAGFATIQYELNEYFRRRVLSYQVNAGTLVAPPIEFGPIPLFESCCNDIVNHTNMFAPANNSDQYNLLQTLLAITPPTKTIVRYPAPLLSTQYPCNFDLMTNCSGLNGSATLDVISCLNQQHETAGSCGIAISYVQQCSATIKTLCNVEAVDFFNIQPNPVSADDCWSKVSGDATCGASSLFGQLINTTGLVTTSLPCGHESMSYCGTPQCSPEDGALGKQCRPDFGCLRQAFDEGRPMSSVCQAALMAVPLCVDDFATICPFDTNSMSVAQIPAVCLHLQRDYISLTCLTSDFFAFVEAVYTDAALIQTVPTDVNFCRTAHQVSLAFYDGVTAGAFPARAYGQNQFYANSGALIGLVVALSFLYPFTAHIRLIVQERTKKQRLYMMLIGVHHSAILVTYTLIGFVLSFLSAIFATVVLSEIFPQVGTDAIFSLFFTYGFSLVGLASFVASFFSSTRLSGAIAPFILFLLAIPAFVVVGSIDFITYLLPPSVAILAADLFVGYSQSSATSAVFSDDLTTATQALFGLGILYIILALLVEQFRVMSTSIGMVGRFSRTVNDRLFGAYRFVMHPFRKTRVYSRLNQQQQVDDDAGNIELAEGGGVHSLNDDSSHEERLTSGGGYGYENFEESGAYRFVMHPFRKTRVYSRLNQQQQVDDEAGNIELAEGGGVHSLNDDGSQEERLTSGGGYGYENFEESMAAAPSTNPNDLRYSIGGVDQDGQAAGGGSSPSSRRSSVGSHQGRQQVWHAAIQLFNVTTSFLTTTSDSASVVLKNVSGLFYKNRLNCVIGGTGSGKSTLIRILMGEWSPDSGKFTIDDEEPTRFNRQDLGVCLQQDVSWDQLTVAEHIELVQLVKGCINLEFMKEEVKTLLSVLNLEDKRDAHADTLSYGMLRKLNVAMSFAGGSRIVLLDEPTASIDPLSRKAVWHLLSANVTNRCIVVSTSYVEELDDAHHIMLLRDGAVKCAGTPQHLKRVTGSVGSFILSVSRGQSLRSDQAMQVVAQLCPKAQLANNVGQELCFRIPRDHAGTLPILLKALRSLRGVSSVAVSDHRMDELFMRVTREQGVREDLFNALTRRVEENFDATTRSMAPMSGDSMAGPSSGYVRDTSASSSANLASPTSASQPSHAATAGGNSIGSDRERDMRLQPGSFALFRQSFSVIFGKRFAVGLSSLLPSTIQFLLPLICISVAMSLLDATSPTYPPLVLDTSAMYGTNDVYMSLENAAPSSSKVKWQTAADVFYNRGTRYIVPSTVGVPWNSSVAVSALLAEEMDNHETPRYGALIVNDTFVNFNIENFLFNATSGLTFSLGNTTLAWKTDSILHNTSSPHALPAFLNNLASMRIWKMTGDTSGGIQVTNFPLPYVTGLVSTSTLIVSIMSEKAVLEGFGQAFFAWFVMVLYGACVISISYIMSKMFKKHSTAQNSHWYKVKSTPKQEQRRRLRVNLLPDNAETVDAKNTNDSLMVLFRFLPT